MLHLDATLMLVAHRRRTLIALSLAAILCYGSTPSFASRPSKIYERNPTSVHMLFDSLNIPSGKTARLTAWLCKPIQTQSDALIILAGPDAGNMSDQLDIVEPIVNKLGVTVLMFDYEGFGSSSNLAIDTDAIAMPQFAEDLRTVMWYAAQNLNFDSSRIALYGRSMGASLALAAASMHGGCNGVIAESPYVSQASLVSACNEKYKRAGLSRLTHAIGDANLDPLDSIHRCKAHVMLIHGSDEDLIPSNEICTLYEKCGSKKKTLWIAAGSRHLEVPFRETMTFLPALISFLNDLDGLKK